MTWKPATPWTANSTSPQADGENQGGDRPLPPTEGLTVVSFDQVDLTWAASSTTMTLVERATAELGPYVTEAWDEAGVSSRRLNNHLPSTTYYYRIRRVSIGGVVTETLALGSATTPAAEREFFVATTGSDSNDGLSVGNAFLTWNKFHSVAAAGDVCYIGAGTYYESTVTSPHVTTREWSGTIDCAQSTQVDGTEALPIVMRAATGDETSVILDGRADTTTFDGSGNIIANNDGVAGIFVIRDHWHFYGFEATDFLGMCIGVKNPGIAPEQEAIVIDDLTHGVVVENCYMHDITDQTGNNTAFVAGWGWYEPSIRNLRLDGSYQATGTRGNAIQWYGTLLATIENIKATNAENCIQMKDHYITSLSPYSTGIEVSSIKGCDFDGRANAISCIQRGGGSNGAGQITVSHSLMTSSTGYGLYHRIIAPSGNNIQSGDITYTGCVFRGGSKDMLVANTTAAAISSNIFYNGKWQFEYGNETGSFESKLASSDYNVFGNSAFSVWMNRYASAGAREFSSLTAWQAATPLDPERTLTFSNPDANSTEGAPSSLFTDESTRDYTVPVTSPAYQLLADGSDAGLYRFGEEIIGVLPSFSWGDI